MAPLLNFLGGSAVLAVLLTTLAPQYSPSASLLGTAAIIFFASGAVYVLYQRFVYPFYFSPFRDLPTPPGASPVFGHARAIWDSPTGKPMMKWANEVPNDGLLVYRHVFNFERILVTSPKALAEVLVTKSYEFVKPPNVRSALGRLLGVGVLLAEGDLHRKQRKDLSPAFNFRHIKELYPVFWSKSIELVERIQKDMKNPPADHEHPANVIEIREYSSRATLDIIGLAGMGRDFGSIADPSNELNQTYKSVFQPPKYQRLLVVVSTFVPPVIMRNLPLAQNMKINKASTYIRTVCADMIASKRAAMEKSGRTEVDILSVALESGGFSDDNLVDQMMTFLAAGHETTSTAMTWATYVLCQHPEWQKRLRDEIHANIPSPRSEEGRKAVNSNMIDNLPILNAVCNETLRVWAPVNMTMRIAEVDTTILDRKIPKGTLVFMSPWATNNDEHLWGSDAGVFDPDRWLRQGQANKGGAESNYAFMTFLHGPRSCIGQKFATAEFACLLAGLVGRFEFEFETPGFEAEIVGGITSRPKGGLWVRMKECENW